MHPVYTENTGKNKSHGEKQQKGKTWHQSKNLIMTQKTKEQGLVKRSNHHRIKRKIRFWLEEKQEVDDKKIRKGDEKDYTVGGERERESERERKKDNLDEKEKLTEAGQQRQQAPQDAVVHIPKLQYERNTQCDDGGWERGEEDRGWDGQKVKYN